LDKELVLIVDALNLFTRHYVAHPAMSVNGEHVGGVIGFLYGITNLIERYKPKKVIVVWEGGGSSRRRKIFSEYKSRRRPQKLNRTYEEDLPDTVENRNRQVSLLVSLINLLPICQIYVPDCEADDVIGYISKYTYSKHKKLILSSDKDFYQLLDENTIIFSPTRKDLVTCKTVLERFNISSNNFALAKSVCGDPSDNIAGVKGVGFKTLAKRFPLLAEKNDVSINDLIEKSAGHIKSGSKLKAFKEITQSEELIRRNWKLIYLDTANLSEEQIRKIKYTVDTFSPKKNKLEMMRALIKEGIQTFNVDRLFLALNYIGA
tara:strand:+ start:278 stop:1234 length:957 start_codon:yes stop_codon:yes gene_type:complete